MTAYYNEIDPYAAQWLRDLIAAGHITAGDVDERNIKEVDSGDLGKYTQCHFFAGIGGWSRALQLAEWADDRPVWTGSCPCQPFSSAGKGLGSADERHLWPTWFNLIRECRPSVIFGEQVASPAALGWWDSVQDDLEGTHYACAAFDLCAAGASAPHIRQRLYWMADTDCERLWRQHPLLQRDESRRIQTDFVEIARNSEADCRMGDTSIGGQTQRGSSSSRSGDIGDRSSDDGVVGVAHDAGPQGRLVGGDGPHERAAGTSGLAGFWFDAEWIYCRDKKYRPVESGTFPLAHGVSGRVGRLRAYGNAIVPPIAAEFVKAYMDTQS